MIVKYVNIIDDIVMSGIKPNITISSMRFHTFQLKRWIPNTWLSFMKFRYFDI